MKSKGTRLTKAEWEEAQKYFELGFSNSWKNLVEPWLNEHLKSIKQTEQETILEIPGEREKGEQ